MATRAVRKALDVSRLKGVTDSDLRLLELVTQFSAPPSISDKAYWEPIWLLYNADDRNKPCRSWRALEMRYKRLPDKVNRLLPSPPVTSVRPPM
jgi:hypothetical protein